MCLTVIIISQCQQPVEEGKKVDVRQLILTCGQQFCDRFHWLADRRTETVLVCLKPCEAFLLAESRRSFLVTAMALWLMFFKRMRNHQEDTNPLIKPCWETSCSTRFSIGTQSKSIPVMVWTHCYIFAATLKVRLHLRGPVSLVHCRASCLGCFPERALEKQHL